MTSPTSRRARARSVAAAGATALVAAVLIPLAGSSAAGATGALAGSTLYANPFSTTLEAAQSLGGQARADAYLLGSIPSAEWFTSGTADEVRAEAQDYVDAATAVGQMPVLVAYNLPFRDCSQYSAGGAFDTAEYQAWIDGLAAGIGDRPATVILEPDGLGIIPHYTTIDGAVEWCQPAELDPATAASDRFVQLNHAVDVLSALPATSVYLDGTHSGWLNVGDITDRLLKAGVQEADGFFVNASNYNFTANLTAYGTWISSCIAYVTQVNPGAFGECGNQYWNGGPANNWTGVTMSAFGEWSSGNPDPALDTAGVDSRYELILGGVEPSTHFVIDTSRNGQGPWQAPEGVYSDPEVWCNPPGRGIGVLPTTETGNALVDAHLWIKVPGESDGKCYRGTGGPLDPERGMEDPAAGQWFVEQARELISLANPPLAPLTCTVEVTGTRLGSGFAAAVVIRNTGSTTYNPWTLSWTFDGDQRVNAVVVGTFVQDGANVTVTPHKLLGKLAPGKRTAFAIKGKGAATEPWLFRLNGQPCLSK
ncbi:glycoside hydrolase family 6 protein [Microbacterium immunditiarum]|uniref:Glucanase n=1 Tax=Microbacterium immunditiarum TaxID=337480 RepID=A0A7Y9KKM1_9MICO|nr:glycoside hydrolase family 6 protein [Microbacterium immunditiarum]NYE18909.1 endoglucanase [Microbacterium immunditiarum]